MSVSDEAHAYNVEQASSASTDVKPFNFYVSCYRPRKLALADPKMKARFADLGAVRMPMIPADFGKLIAEETDKWGKVAKSAGIKPI